MNKIINAFGLHWKPQLIYNYKGLTANNCFKGHVKHGKKYVLINFWNSRGIYALFKNYEVVYIGKVTDRDLGERIRSHFSYMKDHWDTFSFFSFSKINFTKKEMSNSQNRVRISKETIIQTLEAILINTAEPFLNKQETKFPKALKAYQEDFTEEINHKDLSKKIDNLEKLLKKIKSKL